MSDARVITPPLASQSFLSSRSIWLTSTGSPAVKASVAGMVIRSFLDPFALPLLIASQSPPGAPVARQQLICFLRSPRAGWISVQLRRALLLRPRLLNRVDKRPGLLHFITPGEERRVACHRVE